MRCQRTEGKLGRRRRSTTIEKTLSSRLRLSQRTPWRSHGTQARLVEHCRGCINRDIGAGNGLDHLRNDAIEAGARGRVLLSFAVTDLLCKSHCFFLHSRWRHPCWVVALTSEIRERNTQFISCTTARGEELPLKRHPMHLDCAFHSTVLDVAKRQN